MDKMLDAKEVILTTIETLFKEYNKIKEENNENLLRVMNELTELRECNNKLINEISEKDKLLIVNDRKMIDYETMINKIQEDAMKEKTEKERFDMLKKQDKEIHDRDIEIQRLQKKVYMLEDKLSLLDKKSDVDDNIVEVMDEGTKEDTLVKKNQGGNTSETSESEGEDIVEVVDNDKKQTDVEVVNNHEEEVETPVVENPDDKEEGIDNGEETEELSEEEDAEVEIISYYKKEYYLVVNEIPQGIYIIEDGGLGNKVGEVKGGKKIFYKSSKK